MKNTFITIKTTPEVLRLIRLVAVHKGKPQYEVLEELLKKEWGKIKEQERNGAWDTGQNS